MKHIIISIIIAAMFIVTACSGFLDEKSQSEVIPKTTTDFSELLLGTGYPSVGPGSPDISFISLMDDDCAHFLTYNSQWDIEGKVGVSSAITSYPIYSWQPDMADFDGYGNEINTSPISTVYGQFYEKILGCNAVLDLIDEAVGTQEEINRVKAEALAVRALYYFQLVNLYGEPYNHNKNALAVPVKENSNLTDERIARSTVAHIYEDIIVNDLKEASRLMDPLEIIRKNFRINQPAIHILLSRVYLYMEQYDDCIDEVNKAIAQGATLLDMINNIDDILSSSPYLVQYDPISYKNPEVEWLFGRSAADNFDAYMAATAPDFRAIWDQTNDRRWLANAFRDAYGDGTVYMRKPTSSYDAGQSIRSAEAYLNRMEAFALSGEEGKALSELNLFRKKRIIDYVDVSLSGQALLDEIRLERRKELCFEGHRWFDLRRYGMPEIKHIYRFEKGGSTYEFTLKQGDPMYTLPFPNSLIELNTSLEQNSSRSMSQREGTIIY